MDADSGLSRFGQEVGRRADSIIHTCIESETGYTHIDRWVPQFGIHHMWVRNPPALSHDTSGACRGLGTLGDVFLSPSAWARLRVLMHPTVGLGLDTSRSAVPITPKSSADE